MTHIGIDVHKKDSQVCILPEEGRAEEFRIPTRAESLSKALSELPRAQVLIEASTESEWVARTIESLGHEVIVADPNFEPMYGMRKRRVKTDRRDARALAEACRAGTYRRAHRRSDGQRVVGSLLTVRDALVRTRAKYVTLVGTLLRAKGWRLPSGEAEAVAARVVALGLPADLEEDLAPLLALVEPLNAQIAACEHRIDAATKEDRAVQRLQTVPGVGLITAAAFRCVIDTPQRFRDAHQVQAYLGLVPSELSSGEKQRKGRITKTGNSRMRWLLVQAAHSLRNTRRRGDTIRLRMWANRIEAKRGRRVAIVALARKLAGILFAIMRDETEYDGDLTNRPWVEPGPAAA